jgi:DNA-binding PadR family transcriptional regulator
VTNAQHSGFTQYRLENIVLGLLIAGPKHGYGLYREFTRSFARIWKAGQAKFYAALSAAEENGYLEAMSEPQENRPPRKVLHLTEAGRDVFFEWLHQPVLSMQAMRVEFMAKLRFFDLLGLPGSGELIDEQISVLEEMLAEWEHHAHSRSSFDALVEDFRTRQAHFMIEWLSAARQQLAQSMPSS